MTGGDKPPHKVDGRILLALGHPRTLVKYDGVLVRFGEIGIKSTPVRNQMLGKLQHNLLAAIKRRGVAGDVHRLGPRLWVVGPDIDALLDAATHTFGVVSASPVVKCSDNLDEISEIAVTLAKESSWQTFSVRGRREGTHDYTSQELGRIVGSKVFTACTTDDFTPKVDLKNAELEISVDVRDRRSHIYTYSVAGPGGLPSGSQGTAVVLLSDSNSAVAAWLLMRRGCKVVLVHAGDSGSLPIDLVDALAAWGGPEEATVLPVCSGSTSKAALFAAAASIADDVGADVIATGETLDSPLAVSSIPVLRPVQGLAPSMLAQFQMRAGIPDETSGAPLDDSSSETAQSLLSMRRQVSG